MAKPASSTDVDNGWRVCGASVFPSTDADMHMSTRAVDRVDENTYSTRGSGGVAAASASSSAPRGTHASPVDVRDGDSTPATWACAGAVWSAAQSICAVRSRPRKACRCLRSRSAAGTRNAGSSCGDSVPPWMSRADWLCGGHGLWRRRADVHDGDVRARGSRPWLRVGVRGGMRSVQHLRVLVGGVAVRCRRAHLGHDCGAPVPGDRNRLTFNPGRTFTLVR